MTTTTAQHAASGIHYHLPRSQCSHVFFMIFDRIFNCLIWWSRLLGRHQKIARKRNKNFVYSRTLISNVWQKSEKKTHKAKTHTHIHITQLSIYTSKYINDRMCSAHIMGLTDIMAPIHSISNTVYNHFHIFVDTSFIYAKFVPARLSMSAEQDTYNSIVLIHNVYLHITYLHLSSVFASSTSSPFAVVPVLGANIKEW